jgi:hypothetical protein
LPPSVDARTAIRQDAAVVPSRAESDGQKLVFVGSRIAHVRATPPAAERVRPARLHGVEPSV